MADKKTQDGRKQKNRRPIRLLKKGFSKIGTLNIVLMIVGAYFLWFNWQMIGLFKIYGSLPETYACAVVAATIGECGICGWIRTTKDRKREHDWEKEKDEPEEPGKDDHTNPIGFRYEQENGTPDSGAEPCGRLGRKGDEEL